MLKQRSKILAEKSSLKFGNMSKIGKKFIAVPPGVDVNIDGLTLKIKGPKGELIKIFPAGLNFRLENNMLIVDKTESAIWGLGRALAAQMIQGVTAGFSKTLELNGVGYRATVKGQSLEMGLGFSHPAIVEAPEGIAFVVEKNTLTISGLDAEMVGRVAAKIRALRPPEPYKGSGIKYKDEIIRRKAGKKAAGTTA